jgi:DGQHR domain-containing protein
MTNAGGCEETVAVSREIVDWLPLEEASSDNSLRLPALQVRQTADSVLHSFAVDAKLIPRFASVSRLHRGNDHSVVGYQRREVRAHILEIKKYLESPDPLIPNAIVIAFDRRVTFEPLPLQDPGSPSQWGTIVIPYPEEDGQMPGWVVDGQQRVAAMREARIGTFPILVTAFLADSESEQRQQFILVNSTKPLEKGLMYELLPSTAGQLPSALEKRRLPSTLMERLNFDVDSPFYGLIQAPTTPSGIVKDNSILRMIENSLTDGILYRFRDPMTGESDNEAMLLVLRRYWAAVASAFPEAWGLPPRRSRLMHGVGIASMGYLMDAIADRHCDTLEPSENLFLQDLEAIKPYCRWTNGYWDFGPGAQFKWNELQNTSRHIGMLANYLLVVYKSEVWSGGDRAL